MIFFSFMLSTNKDLSNNYYIVEICLIKMLLNNLKTNQLENNHSNFVNIFKIPYTSIVAIMNHGIGRFLSDNISK